MNDCPLCTTTGGTVVWHNELLRVVRVDDHFAADHPGFTRVIWESHVTEMTDLVLAERNQLMQAVWAVEAAQRRYLHPDKVNLASFGNMVPHVHWHIIPRYRLDAHWPQPVWGIRNTTGAASSHDSTRYLQNPAPNLADYWAALPSLVAEALIATTLKLPTDEC